MPENEEESGYRLAAARNERLNREIEALKKDREWIACAERMPNPDQGVIVYGPQWRDWPIAIYKGKNDMFPEHWFAKSGDHHISLVTHWLPIPTPPL